MFWFLRSWAGAILCIQKAPREQLRGSYSQLHSRRKCCTVYHKIFLLFLTRGTETFKRFLSDSPCDRPWHPRTKYQFAFAFKSSRRCVSECISQSWCRISFLQFRELICDQVILMNVNIMSTVISMNMI